MASTVLITGGSGGIGRAICREFGRTGWRVAVHYHGRASEAEDTCRQVKELGGEAIPVPADIRDRAAVDGMVQAVTARWGSLDLFIANAGVASSGLVLRVAPKDWDDAIEINLTGTFYCLQSAGRIMLHQRSGCVIVIGSFAALQGHSGQAAYAASKAGLIGLLKTAAREWGPFNVRINMVLPGWHRTTLAGSVVPEASALDDHVLGRSPHLVAVAKGIYALAMMPDASGQVWNLDSRIL
jgi:3-oxoacyl-[acyl-carrier protein] reductase